MADRVAGVRSPPEAARVVTGFLGPRLATRASGAAVTDVTVRALVRSRGQFTIDALAAGTGVSTRHLERLFRRDVGLSPKRLARVVRLQGVLRRLGEGPARWVDIALECGYADQAHLTREFRELAGQSPARWIGGNGDELARRFTAPERLDAFFGG